MTGRNVCDAGPAQIGLWRRVATTCLVAANLLLAACASGPDPMSQADVVQPMSPATPASTSRMPLLPPVPVSPAPQSAPSGETWSTAAPPLQYDKLYSDEEQARIQSDLIKAAASAKPTQD